MYSSVVDFPLLMHSVWAGQRLAFNAVWFSMTEQTSKHWKVLSLSILTLAPLFEVVLSSYYGCKCLLQAKLHGSQCFDACSFMQSRIVLIYGCECLAQATLNHVEDAHRLVSLCAPPAEFVRTVLSLCAPPAEFVLTVLSLCAPPAEFVRTACWVCAHRAEFVRTACWVCAHRLLSLCAPPAEFVRTACWVCAHRAEFVRTACWVCAHRLLSLCAPCWVCAHCAEFVRSSPSQWIFQQRHEVADMWIHTSSKIFQFTFEIVTLATCNWFIQPSSLNWITPVRNMWRNFMVPGTMVAPFP